jgi:hypothetical protein
MDSGPSTIREEAGMNPRLIQLTVAMCLAAAAKWALGAPLADRELELVVLADLNGNASAELATLVSEPQGAGGVGQFGVVPTVYVKDSATGARISSFRLFELDHWHTLELIAVPLSDGSLIGALQQHSGGAIRITLYDAATGAFVRNIAFLDTSRTAIAATFVPDATGPGVPGLAVLAWVRPIDGRGYSYTAGEEVIIEVRRPDTGERLQKLYNLYYPAWDYGYDVRPLAIAQVDDQNGNGSSELAVLARVWGYRKTIAVVTRDTQSADYLSPYNLGNGEATMIYTNIGKPVGFVSLPDASGDGQAELAVLGSVGNVYRLQLREITDGALVWSRRTIVDWTPRQIRALGDVDGNGAAEIAVAALRPNGRITVDVRDGATQALTSRTNFLPVGFDPRGLEVLPDQSGNGVEELAVLGRNPQSGEIRIQIRDAATGELLRTLLRP